MINLIHTGDLHLSLKEEEYSLAVLAELVEVTKREKARGLLISGDLFDSYDDLYGLRKAFREITASLEVPILYIPGNHEHLGKGKKEFRGLDLGKVNIMDLEPCSLVSFASVEVLGIPHQMTCNHYPSWRISPKKKPRIIMAHGSLEEVVYTGLEEEEGGSILPQGLVAHLEGDYLALGHIHRRRLFSSRGIPGGYPGSPRVWRKGEEGPRGVHLLTLEKGFSTRFLPLKKAGEFRSLQVPLSFEGIPGDFSGEMEEWGPADWVELTFSGVVEEENTVAFLEKELIRRFSPHLRRFTLNREGVEVFRGIANHPLAARFLELWKNKEPSDPGTRAVWLKSREIVLKEIRKIAQGG